MNYPLPDKSPKPEPGEPWHWKQRYFDVGDQIMYRDWHGVESKTGTVTRVKANRMGRISYYTGDRFVITEDVSRDSNGMSHVAP